MIPGARGAPPGGALRASDADVLRELASVGCGNALTALGRLARRPFEMDVPELWAWPGPAASERLGVLCREVLAVGVRLAGLLCGHLVLALPARDAARLARALGEPVPTETRPGDAEAPPGAAPTAREAWSPLAESALLESGNVVGSAFVSAVARMVHGKLLLSVPTLARGDGRACLDALVPREEAALALATRFVSAVGEGGVVEGLVIVVPTPGSLPPLLEALRGVD